MSSTTVHISNIAHNTSETDLTNFFSFCGKITSISLTPTSREENSPLSATINFQRESAAKTAVMLDGTKLNQLELSVKAAHNIDEIAGANLQTTGDIGPDGEIPQESKPRSAIFAECLAAGYVLGDAVLERGIELDKKHGLTARFANLLTSALQTVESKTHALDAAKSMDHQYAITEKALSAGNSLAMYFEKALDTGPGNKLRQFYTSSEKKALDVHNEAKRLAELKIQKRRQSQELRSDGQPIAQPDTTTCDCGGEEGRCGCPPGKCACVGCSKACCSDKQEAATKASIPGQFDHAFQDIKNAAHDAAPAIA